MVDEVLLKARLEWLRSLLDQTLGCQSLLGQAEVTWSNMVITIPEDFKAKVKAKRDGLLVQIVDELVKLKMELAI